MKSNSSNRAVDENEGNGLDEALRSVQAKMLQAMHDRGTRSFEFQTLKLQYRNLVTGVRMGLL